jgi:hypothetical protein
MDHSLNSEHLVETVHILHKRISERFPNSGLSKVCLELHTIAKETKSRCQWIKKPQILLRLGVGLVIFFILFLTFFLLIAGIGLTVKDNTIDGIEFVDFLQILEMGVNMVILIGAALFFFITTETRKKRKRAMMSIHELRAIAHVIDMHQLTKDPERVFSNKNRTASSPQQTMTAFELTRYLDYCTEMLSLVGKVAALYAQDFEDQVVLAAVNDVENLTTGLSRKIWQKIVILYQFKQKANSE